ncbi:MAG: PAS domain S-box protein [Candidatus Binatia bacterium]
MSETAAGTAMKDTRSGAQGLLRYAVASAAALVVVLMPLSLTPAFGNHFRFMLLLPAVVFSAWYGGLGAGLVSTLLCAAGAACLWLGPASFLASARAQDLTALCVFVLVGGFISLVSENLVQARRRLESSLVLLRANEEHFRAMFELASVGKAELDLTGRFVRVNRRMCEITGYSAEELLAMSFIALTHPEDRPRDAATFHRLSTGEITEYSTEKRYCRRNGSVVWVHVAAALSRDAAGEPRSSVAVVQDITDRKRAEEALEQRARHAALAADIGVALTGSDAVRDMLQRCTEAIVRHLDAAFARIWTCDDLTQVLELQASAGRYTHLDGLHGRIPVGTLKIGVIAANRRPHLTNAVIGDPHISDQDWARREGMVAFAGYPLIVEDQLIGVVAMFARSALPESALAALGSVADEIALGIKRRRTESALREGEERFRAIFDSVNDAIVVHELPSGAILDVNRRMGELYGYTREEARQVDIGMLSSGIPPYTQESALTLIKKAVSEGPQVVEWQARDKNGRLFWVEVSLRRATIGAAERMLVTLHDITERKRIEAALVEADHQKEQLLATLQATNEQLDRRVLERTTELTESNARLRQEIAAHRQAEAAWRESETRFTEFMEHLPGVAFMKDVDGRYVWVNPTFERIFDEPLAYYVGKTDDQVWPAPTAAQFRATDQAALQTRQMVQVTEPVPHADGTHYWVVTKFPILNEHGMPRLLAGVAIDVTEAKRTEAQLRNLEKLAQQRERLADIGVITAQIVHDLGNPLAGLSMQAQLMLHRARRDQSQPVSIVIQPLEHILNEVHRLDGRIKELMYFSRDQRLQLKPIDLTGFLQEVVDAWRPLAAERGIVVTMDTPEHCPSLTADDEKLRRVLDNLLKNAIEAIGRGPGRVGIAVSLPAPETVRIWVRDTGPGIPNTVEAFRLFETTKANGSGLGLPVVKQIVLAHRGTIEFSPVVPHGTVFCIELPRGTAQARG